MQARFSTLLLPCLLACGPVPEGVPGPLVLQTGILTTGDSIVASLGAGRGDPEGVAPPAANVHHVTWKDSRHADRSVFLGAYLYQYDFSFLDNGQVVQRSANDDAAGHAGFGYVVSHNTWNDNSPLGKAHAPDRVVTTVFAGGHHSIHRVELVYDRDSEDGGFSIKLPVVIEWLLATGRDHPVWAVTWKVGEASNPHGIDFNDYRMDVRGPYGSLNFDGAAHRDQGDVVGGVAWGDVGYRFTTTGDLLSLSSPWTYDAPSTVNFVAAWTAHVNAEMGIVQTRAADNELGYPNRVVGRERGSTAAQDFADKGDCTSSGDDRGYVMPCVSGWPYQLMNYDWEVSTGKPVDEATGTKLVAWGSPSGWLGAASFDRFDFSGEADGRGDRAYATFIVLGPRCRHNLQSGQCEPAAGEVALAVAEVEALAAATIDNVYPGSLVTQVPQGPGAASRKTIAQGYNDTYAAYSVRAAGNQTSFTFTPAAGKPVKNPVFVIQNYTVRRLPQLWVDDNSIAVNTGTEQSGAFVSIDTASDSLWVTLNMTLAAPSLIQVFP